MFELKNFRFYRFFYKCLKLMSTFKKVTLFPLITNVNAHIEVRNIFSVINIFCASLGVRHKCLLESIKGYRAY